MMDINAFKKACFDLVKEANDIRTTDPDIADLLVKVDDSGSWIRFTAIGALLDYCKSEKPGSVFSYCVRGVVLAMLTCEALKDGD